MAVSNSSDPLRNPSLAPDAARELFQRLSQVANGFGREDVTAAAANLLVNAVRQSCASRRQAEVVFDDLFGRAKALLLDQHYDGAGKRRSVFPFDQAIHVPLMRFRNKQ